MERIQTQISGISTTSVYEEGASYSLVNLRKKNGVLHPVAPRKIVQNLSQEYDIVFVHQYLTYENWIGIKHISDTESKIYWNILGTPEEIILNNANVKINSIEQIGNTLSLITNNEILYLLYDNEKYIILGEIPEIEPIHFIIDSLTETVNVPKEDIPLPFYGEDSLLKVQQFFIGQFNKAKINLFDKMHGCLFDAHLMVFAFRLFDGTYTKHSSPILITPNIYPAQRFRIKQSSILEITILYDYYKVHLNFDTSYLENWKDIIASIDVFISLPLEYNSESNITDIFPDESQVWYQNPDFNPNKEWTLLKDQSKMISNIKLTDNFYLVDSINIGEISNEPYFPFYFPKQSKISSVNSDILAEQDRLSPDNFSHNKLTGSVSYTYNRRLHLANIKTTLFEGFNFNYFTMLHSLELYSDQFNGFKFNDYISYYYPNGIMIAIDIKIENQTKTVYSKALNANGFYFWINPYFSYPDPRAFRARFYQIDGNNIYTLINEIILTPSDHLNLSYYINSEYGVAKPPIPNVVNGQQEEILIEDEDNTYIEPGKLKVSGLNDPFIFPNENTYIIGNGIILAIATIAPRISEGSFGQYPLYVFTSKGIYAMNIGTGDVVYSNESAPTSYEIPTTKIVCETPFGIVFTSARGICMIIGQEVQLLTSLIQEHPKILNIQSNPNLKGVLLNYGEMKFTNFLNGIEFILYNPLENEIIVADKDSPFNYILNLDSKQFYQSTEKIDVVVQNIFPQLKVIENQKLKDYSESETSETQVSIISRPILFGTSDFKKLERMILRSLLFNVKNNENGNKTHILNYFSIDGINFDILRGIPINPGSYKDFDMGLFARSKYRQFLFAFAGILDEKSQIQYLDIEIEKEYSNTKMR